MTIRTLTAEEEHDGLRLDVFLVRSLVEAPSRTYVKKLIDRGCVRVNEKLVKVHHKLAVGDQVSLEYTAPPMADDRIEPEAIPLDIVYEDGHLLAVNKPAGMTVHPAAGVRSGTLVNALLHYTKNLSDINSDIRPGIVHRLDKETSGILLVAKDNAAHVRLARQFENRTVRKCYVALVEGEVVFDEGVIDAPIGRHLLHREKKSVQFDDAAREASTRYRVLKRKNGVTLVALFPKTGRTHQLRVHMAHLGHPILGDGKYGKKRSFPRLALHARSIGFRHPVTKLYLEFSVRAPQEFLAKVA